MRTFLKIFPLFIGLSISCSENTFQNSVEEVLANKKNAAIRNIPEYVPTPLEWAEAVDGSGIYHACCINYFYIGDEPDYINEDKYNFYAHFWWSANFPENNEICKDYFMQIQYSYSPFGEDPCYIHAPGNKYGLVDIIHSRTLEDLPAHAFPYCDTGRRLYLRIRTVHKDFLNAKPDKDAEYLYDRSMFSPWESWTDVGEYYNYYGFGKPQPSPPLESWDGSDPEIGEGEIFVVVNFPQLEFSKDYQFSYQITNINSGCSEIFRDNNTNMLGIGTNMISNIGHDGGFIEIFATCTNIKTDEYAYANKIVNYGPSERSIEVYFYGDSFHFN